MSRLVAALALLAVLASPAGAVKPAPRARSDAKRFGLDRVRSVVRKTPSSSARQAFKNFNAAQGGRWKLRFSDRTGLPAALIGGRDYPRSGPPDQVARQFLSAHQDVLGVDAAGLRLEKQVEGNGARHLLYRQSYKGIPVEFAAVKVHVDRNGSVIGVHSSYEPELNLPTTPAVSADAAGRAAVADAGGGAVRASPELVVAPLETDGRNHLAWKMRVDGGGGAWRYFVDALTGQVLFRYSANEYVCFTSGTVSGLVYDLDQRSSAVVRPFNNQYVYVGGPPVGPTRYVTGHDATYGDGFFCADSNQGKVAMSLQGPYVSVAEFRGPSAHYDNGSGQWFTTPTPQGSNHPYLNDTTDVKTLNISGAGSCANSVEFLPVFASFDVGGFSGGDSEGSGDIIDDDQLFIYDGSHNPVASYIGGRGPFNGAAVHGQSMSLELRSNAAGTANGYSIAVSSCLVLNNANQDGAPSSHTWTTSDTSLNLRSELNLFYHLNKMHDYLFADVNKSSAAPVVRPVVAMAHVGPNLVNAFYDPDYDDLYFGEVNSAAPLDAFTDDATVPHHEYMHYIVEKIWSIQNYGQAGTISEAQADYFSASSLDNPEIGVGVVTELAGSGPLRLLDCPVGSVTCNCPTDGPSPCYYQLGNSNTAWTGEIHSDSPFVSQALWDIRRDRIATLGYANGKSCVDNLVFQSLLYFPESFSELQEAMLDVDHRGVATACGGADTAQGAITHAFNDRMGLLLALSGDGYEPNDGFETAADISTITAVSAKILPAADIDFFTFGAGPGLVQATLSLPVLGGGLYTPYQMFLYDASRRLVAHAAPALSFGADQGACLDSSCATSQSAATLSYNNPTGGQLYLQVNAADGLNGSASDLNSTTPYGLRVTFPQSGALAGSVVNAKFDRDVLGFTVQTSTFVSRQDWTFAAAQLRDQAYQPIANTLTHVPALAGDFLNFVSSRNAYGVISGSVQLSTGFAARYPSAGTVYLEVFGANALGKTASLGLSNPINLSAQGTELTAYNNILTPGAGQKATVKYAVSGPGHLTLKLYTSTGRLVSTLFDGDVTGGKGSVDWDGHNQEGNTVASGVYVVRAEGPGLRTTQKIVVVK